MAVQLKPDTEALLEQEALRRGQDADTLVREFLHRAQEEGQARREQALQNLMTFFDQGLSFGGEKFNREEIYEDRARELEERREPTRLATAQ